ncbi:4Fe-4S binding protein [Methanobacterium sp. MBAC-LM]|jgi:polyferredoxin|uniref:4Fe-4S binding protein n=1 Tax=Methanobacterium sp. MBAC-LM TaxID=3412034 RepID=UPI003C77E511
MKNHKIRIRTYILIALVIMLPVLFNLYSPVLLSLGIRNGIITASFIVFAVWFIISLFMGRSASCGYTCPYGALQELVGKYVLNKKPKHVKADKIRYIVFVFFFLMVSYFVLKIGGLKGVDLFAPNGNPQLVILIPAFIITIGLLSVLFGSRAFCRYLCPQGVFLTIGAKLGRKIKMPSLHLISNHKDCSDCKLCDKSCPMGLNVSHMVKNNDMENPNCILCGECIEKCPKETINYTFSIKD